VIGSKELLRKRVIKGVLEIRGLKSFDCETGGKVEQMKADERYLLKQRNRLKDVD